MGWSSGRKKLSVTRLDLLAPVEEVCSNEDV